MRVCNKIFREYDIRGVVGPQITPQTAFEVGRAFGSVVRQARGQKICVGRDGRLSSPELTRRLIEGLMATGLQVMDIGIGPTPYAHYGSRYLGCEAMMMVTGSHNPGDQNGFKMALNHLSFWGEDVRALKDRIETQNYVEGQGTYQEIPLQKIYTCFLAEDFLKYYPSIRPLRVAWDPGNGAAGGVIDQLVTLLPGTHFVVNAQIDGHFPAHHPDPTVAKNLTQLQDLVRENACDLGVAFDGDGDRLGVVDGKGRILWGDEIMELFAKEVLTHHPGACIIADVKASENLFDVIRSLGGQALMWKTGHSLIKSKMHETGALLAGELSGHLFFADRYFGYDDAVYAALRLIGICGGESQSLADWASSRPQRFSTPEMRLECPARDRFDVVARVAHRAHARGLEVDATDGVRVKDDRGWWLLRASHTQDLLVARVEAHTPEHRDALLALVKDFLNQEGVSFETAA